MLQYSTAMICFSPDSSLLLTCMPSPVYNSCGLDCADACIGRPQHAQCVEMCITIMDSKK